VLSNSTAVWLPWSVAQSKHTGLVLAAVVGAPSICSPLTHQPSLAATLTALILTESEVRTTRRRKATRRINATFAHSTHSGTSTSTASESAALTPIFAGGAVAEGRTEGAENLHDGFRRQLSILVRG
jgi:hypothetical protein